MGIVGVQNGSFVGDRVAVGVVVSVIVGKGEGDGEGAVVALGSAVATGRRVAVVVAVTGVSGIFAGAHPMIDNNPQRTNPIRKTIPFIFTSSDAIFFEKQSILYIIVQDNATL